MFKLFELEFNEFRTPISFIKSKNYQKKKIKLISLRI
jgi:hypothetical protein